MDPEPVRFVHDRFEWASLAKTPVVYHRWEWAEQSRRRVARQSGGLAVDTAYMRVWLDDSLVVCPMLLIGDTWFNIPRAEPEVIGPWVEPYDALDFAVEVADVDIELVDDSLQLLAIDMTIDRLRRETIDTRSRRSITSADIDTLAAHLTWKCNQDRTIWLEAIGWVARSGLDIRLVEYRTDGPIGWSVDAHLDDLVWHLAAVTVDSPVDDWTSPR